MKHCLCTSPKNFQECCQPYIEGTQQVPNAEALMRSRYSAYTLHDADYLMATTHSSKRKYHSREEILHWAVSNQWLRLEIIKTSLNTVEFKAYFLDETLKEQVHHEKSTFKFENGSWFYVDGIFY